MKVCLNGNFYELKAGTQIIRQALIEFPSHIRSVGQQKRDDRTLISNWNIKQWNEGFGIYKMDSDDEGQRASFWDSELDTRTPGQIILGAQPIHCTIDPAPGIELRHLFVWQNNIHFMTATAEGGWIVYQFTPPSTIGSLSWLETWTPTASRQPIGGILGYNKWIYYTHATGAELVQMARNIPSLAYTATPPALVLDQTTFIKDRSDCDIKVVLNQNNAAELAVYGVGTSGDGIYQRHTNITDNLNFKNNRILSSQPVPTQISPIAPAGDAVYLFTPNFIYDVFPSGAPDLLLDTSQTKDNEALGDVFGNNIIVKNFEQLLAINPNNLTITDIGLTADEGLPTAKRGEITAMCQSWSTLFAAVQVNNPYIYTYDAAGWHFLAKVPSIGAVVRRMYLTTEPDDIRRLWLLYRSGNPNYILNPLYNPLTSATYCYATGGYLDFPTFDGGMAEIDAGFFDWTINLERIGTPHTTELLYGLDYTVPTQSLGNVATNSHQFILGSPYGVVGRRIQPRLSLTSTSTGTTPIIKDLMLHYLKLPKTRETFTFTIDLQETAIRENRPLEALIGSLINVRDSKTLLPFWYGRMGTKNIKVLEMPALEELEAENIYESERQGMVTVRLAELI